LRRGNRTLARRLRVDRTRIQGDEARENTRQRGVEAAKESASRTSMWKTRLAFFSDSRR
jgi:hypothetical protein